MADHRHRPLDQADHFFEQRLVGADFETLGSGKLVGALDNDGPAFVAVDDITLTRPTLQLDLAERIVEELRSVTSEEKPS